MAEVVPAAAADDAARALGRPGRVGDRAGVVFAVPVLAPFPDVAVQVVQAERVGPILTHLAGAVEGRPRVGGVGVLAIDVGLARVERGRGDVEEERLGEADGAAAGVLPLGLGRQAVDPSALAFGGQGVQPDQEGLRVIPGHALDGQRPRVDAAHAAEVAGVLARHPLVLRLRHREGAEVEVAGDGDGVGRPLVVGAAELGARRAHAERPDGYQHQLHPDRVDDLRPRLPRHHVEQPPRLGVLRL